MSRSLLFAAICAALTPAVASAEPVPEPDRDSARRLARVVVVGDQANAADQPGSVSLIDAEEIRSARVFSVSEALRKAAGVVVRDEEGFGIRPNIGIRGLNPTRSTKVLLLEDGIPAAYAPYGDNASYYHAPVDRYERIEILKGVGMLNFGPQTIGGVINYITADPPEEFGGQVSLTGGNRSYFNGRASIGGGGFLADFVRKQGDGARDTLELEQTDFNVKYAAELGEDHALTLRGTWLNEDSQVGYSGLTEAEYRNFGRNYGFDQNADFGLDRYGASATHEWSPSADLSLTTSAYGFYFERDWWRQSSTTTDTQCGTAFRDARLRGDRVDFDACNSAQGRLRDYDTYGIEPRLRVGWEAFGAPSEFQAGARAHWESQERRQVNANSPTGRSGTTSENQRRETRAQSAFASNRFEFGELAVVPAVRVEHIEYERLNRLNGRAGTTEVTEWVPGLGFHYRIDQRHTLFAGAHRGFAPARAEDIIDGNGGVVEVDAEDSRNLEIGWRANLSPGNSVEATLFRNNFLNQILVGSIAGGNTPLAEGKTLYQGFEFSGLFSRDGWVGEGRSYANVALTWLPTARQESALRSVASGAIVGGSAAGKRLPYAPEQTATIRIGHIAGPWDASIEGVYVGQQYGDFANRTNTDPSGQFGQLGSYALVNLALNYTPLDAPWGLFLTVKNAADRDYIADRTRGIQVGPPRMVQAGVSWMF
jgi:Fe(3+) dicitrate transport protein